jgi:hypothetical protein
VKLAHKRVARELGEIRIDYRNHCERWSLDRDSPAAHEEHAEAPLRGALGAKGLTTAAEVLDRWPRRVLSREEMQRLEAEDAKRARQRKKAMVAWAAAAEALRRGETTEELLSGRRSSSV